MRDRQMHKYGHRVGFRGGGGQIGGTADMSGGSTRGGPPGGGDQGMSYNAPPTAPTGRDIDDTYTDTSFNTTPTQKGFFGNLGTGIKNYVMGGGMIGMGLRGLGSLFGGSTISNGNVGPAGFVGPGPIGTDGIGYGTVQDAINTSRRNEPHNNNQGGDGIMNLYQPNMLNVSGEVDETINTDGGEIEDYVQRFQVKDEFRKSKGADLGIENAAIAEMISKLYS